MLNKLFTSKARAKILKKILLSQNANFYIRELSRDLNEQVSSIKKEVELLEQLSVLTGKKIGNRKYYGANKNCLFGNEIYQLVLKMAVNLPELTRKIKKTGELKLIVCTGIFTNAPTAADILIVGESIDKQKLQNIFNKISEDIILRYSLLNNQEYEYRVQCKDNFILSIMQDNQKIELLNKIKIN